MSRQHHVSGRLTCLAALAALLLLGAGTANAQWVNKPAPELPRSVLDRGESGSVVLNLVFARDGRVVDASVVRSSGIAGLDRLAVQGARQWRLDPAAVTYADQSSGRQHMIKFFQDDRVARRVEPIKAFWKEL